MICAKVGRYAERFHHPDRLARPLRRVGPKGSGSFAPIGWDEALDEVAEAFLCATQRYGSETVWPYYYAGTMGLVQRDGINRLRHTLRYSGWHSTICVMLSDVGWKAGHGKRWGVIGEEMVHSDLIVIWGTNPVSTQVNVMTHVARARKARGAKLVVVDPYRSNTAALADTHLALRPGTDGALACAVMHVLFRDGYADRAYLARYADDVAELEAHLATRTPEWAARITGLSVETIEDFAQLYGRTRRSYLRLGFGFTRSRNGAANMHAASCLPVVTGAWQHEGGGALYNQGDLYHWDKTRARGAGSAGPCDPAARPIPHRPGAGRRPPGPRRRPAGDSAPDPEHQPDGGGAGARQGARGVRARRPVRVRPRAVHDRDRAHGRHRAAGDHVPRARRHLSGLGPHPHPDRAQNLRALRRVSHATTS